ncbi:hypothetical protein [Janibacter hoylei]|uniref:hypothetical protein n=1 Tax=Janibacter hoylei TaxID=364298 RepID=UPI00030AC149|nr:hypothetical protein [Janibacter hoylei]
MSTQDRKAKAQAAAGTTGRGANVIVVAGIVIVLAMALVVGGVIWASRDDGASTTGTSQLPDGVTKGEPIEPFAAAKPPKDAPRRRPLRGLPLPGVRGLRAGCGRDDHRPGQGRQDPAARAPQDGHRQQHGW